VILIEYFDRNGSCIISELFLLDTFQNFMKYVTCLYELYPPWPLGECDSRVIFVNTTATEDLEWMHACMHARCGEDIMTVTFKGLDTGEVSVKEGWGPENWR
jgi:hypothetical protein